MSQSRKIIKVASKKQEYGVCVCQRTATKTTKNVSRGCQAAEAPPFSDDFLVSKKH